MYANRARRFAKPERCKQLNSANTKGAAQPRLRERQKMTKADVFEKAIVAFGVDAACEYFGYSAKDKFTKDLKDLLKVLPPIPCTHKNYKTTRVFDMWYCECKDCGFQWR
jgi:hypothetical protein